MQPVSLRLVLTNLFLTLFLITPGLADEAARGAAWTADGLTLSDGIHTVKPLKSFNIKLVPGISGKAIYIPDSGRLEYPAGRLVNRKSGTITFWLKLDKSPSGILSYRDRDRLANGDWGNKLGGSPFNRTLFETGGLRSTLNSGISFTALGSSTRNVMIVKRVFADEWHHLAFTWQNGGNINFFLDGILQRPEKAKSEICRIGNILMIGSGKYGKGLGGTIDRLSISSKVLTSKEIHQRYAEYHPFRYELLDYALTAGRENNVRFRVRNISGEKLKRTLEIVGRKIVLELKPDELKDFSVAITPPQEGLFDIICNGETGDKKVFEAYALNPSPGQSKANHGKARLKLITQINCAAPPEKGEYTDAGTCRVVNGYRESTVSDSGIGFAYRMRIKHPGKPHWLEVEYPDDATRSFIVFVYPYKYNRIYTSSLDSIGIVTGAGYPVTGKMHTKRLLFWPDSNEIAVAVVAYRPLKNHSGPAVARIRLYENIGPLPVADVPVGGRGLARWQEDPMMTARLWFNHAANYQNASLEFWKIKWSRVIDYMRYNGFNAWIIQSMDYFGDASGMDATLQEPSYLISKGGRVPGWDDLGAALLEQNDLGFYIRLNPIVYTKSKWFLNLMGISNPDQLRIVTRDGTELIGFRDNVNILHPAVQNAYKKIIRAYRDKFSRFKNFKGICFNEHMDFSLQNLDQGYDDYSCKLFEQETGIMIPASKPADRYDWLMKNAKAQWLDWRCKKVTEFAAKLGRVIQEKGNGTLKVQLWISAYRLLADLKDWPRYNAEQSLRGAGIDLAELNKLPGITVVPSLRPDYERIHAGSCNEEYLVYSPELTQAFRKGKLDTVNILRHSNMEIYWNLGSKKYKFKPFWHPAGTNLANNVCIGFSTPLPNTEFALDIMTHCLAEYDLQNIIHGWWGNVENGEHEAFRKFYTAFRNIPSGHYDLAPGANDPVAVRVGAKGFYMVNREGYPVSVTYILNGKKMEKKLSGNEIYSEQLSSRPKITNVNTSVPQNKIDYLEALINKLKLVRKKYVAMKRSAKTLDHVIKLADKAMKERCYTRVRHLMYAHAAMEALNEISVSIVPEYDWLHKTLKIRVSNIGPEPFSGALVIKTMPKGWTVDRHKVKIEKVICGQNAAFTFKFKGGKLRDWELFRIKLQGNGRSREYQYRFPCCFAGEDNFEKPGMSRAFVHSNGHLLNKNAAALRKRLEQRIVGRYTLQWDRAGSGIRVLAEIDDPQFIPPAKRGNMYLGDSIQIYFDQRNNAEADAIGYDNDDVSFQVGMLNGKPEVWRDTRPRGIVDIPAVIEHKNGKTRYEVFIPETQLPMGRLKPGNVIGFGILFNQLMKDENGEFMLKLTRLGETYRHPGNWQDFYLSSRRPESNAIIRLSAYNGILSGIKLNNGKLKEQAPRKSFLIESPALTDQPTVVTAAFVPETDELITLNIGAGYMDRVKYISVRANGVELLSDNSTGKSANTLPEDWKISGRTPRVVDGGMDVPYGCNLARNIKVVKGKPVVIEFKISLPDEVK